MTYEETAAVKPETKEETAAVKTETEEEITVIETETEEETAAAETGTEGEADVSTGELTESQESPDTEVPEETEEESIEEAADEAASEEDTATTQELKLTRSLLSSTDSVATTYVSDSYTIYYNNLDGNLVIEEGATLTISDDYLSLNGYTLTNYGTINESSAIFICLSGVFYNYGVYRFGDITGNYDNENIYDLALSSVGLSAGILSPSFSQGIREYAVTVDYDVTSIDITPTLNTGTGVKCMTVNGATATSGTASTVSLRVGENKIPIVITADDENSTTNTYTLTVTRESNEIYIIDIANFVSAGTLGISQDMLQWSDVEAPGGYLLEIYTESGKYVADYPDLTVNYIEACEVLTSSGNFYFTVYALDEDGNELSFKTSDIFTYTHTHTLEYAEAVEATCEEEGNTEYWFCLDCGKYFSDSDATTEISLSDTVVYGHTYDTNGFCTGCGRYQPAELNSGGVYEISNAGQLFWFASLVNGDTAQEGITEAAAGANAVLTVNISLSTTTATHTNTGWTPIGDYSRSTAPYYSGTFDGQNHTVSGLYINSSNDYQGLFGYIGSSGMVQNVTVSGSVSASGYVGGVAGYNGGTVQNVTVSGSVSASGNAGGVAGYNSGIVQNVTVSGSVTASGNYAGGAVGRNDGTVRNVTAGVMVTGTNRVGGVVGFNDGGTVTYCINSGTASCSNMNAGGVAGYNNGTVKNCYSSGTVSGSYVGGVVGWNNSGTVGNCYSSGNVSGSKNVGGVAGLNSSNGGTVMNCYYLEGAADAAIGSDSGLSESVAAKTAKEFASGEVAYLLNGSVSGGTTWYQNIDNSGTADSYPVLNSTHGTVCCGTDCTGTAIYSNRTVPAAAHSYEAVVTEPTCTEKGYTTYTCSICGDSYTAD
ncbi:MAG: cadherin-like beta sandwich domain-containing protein, partial [Lachnospiraceae bacterium]|nr:cadherin-like beta sandwich domain-containing protein [Lachnospiraceae bacterium]